MKFLTATILTALLSFVSGLFLPWWGIAIVALAVAALIHQQAGKAWLSGFLGVFILWAGLAGWIDMQNQSVLSHKVANILPLGGKTLAIIAVTGFIGGLVGGFAALTGSFLRSSRK